MKKYLGRVLNFLGFYFGWGVCLQRAYVGDPFTGVGVVLLLLAVHLWLVSDRRFETVLILSVALMGTLIDTTYGVLHLIVYKTRYPVYPLMAPAWVTAIWVLYGMSLNHAFVWLENKPWVSPPLGAVGGLLSYLACERAGAIRFPHHFALTLGFIGLCWAFLFPSSLVYTKWLKKKLGKKKPLLRNSSSLR